MRAVQEFHDGGREHLPVRRVVAEEAELGHDDAERRGEGELPPRVADEHDAHPDQHEGSNGQHHLGPVPGVATLHQPALPDRLRQVGVEALVARQTRRDAAWTGRRQAQEKVPA